MIDHHALYIKLKRKMIKSDIKRGDIYYASLNPVVGSEQKGERPVVVIQNNLGNKYSPTVIIAPLTEVIKKADLPTHITIFRNDFLKYDSMILLEQLRTIDKSRLISYLGKLKDNQLQKIDNALIKTLSINIIGYLFSLGIGEYNEKKNERIYSDYYFKETKTRDSIKSNKQKRSKRNGHWCNNKYLFIKKSKIK